jgi:hypothetical protein
MLLGLVLAPASASPPTPVALPTSPAHERNLLLTTHAQEPAMLCLSALSQHYTTTAHAQPIHDARPLRVPTPVLHFATPPTSAAPMTAATGSSAAPPHGHMCESRDSLSKSQVRHDRHGTTASLTHPSIRTGSTSWVDAVQSLMLFLRISVSLML